MPESSCFASLANGPETRSPDKPRRTTRQAPTQPGLGRPKDLAPVAGAGHHGPAPPGPLHRRQRRRHHPARHTAGSSGVRRLGRVGDECQHVGLRRCPDPPGQGNRLDGAPAPTLDRHRRIRRQLRHMCRGSRSRPPYRRTSWARYLGCPLLHDLVSSGRRRFRRSEASGGDRGVGRGQWGGSDRRSVARRVDSFALELARVFSHQRSPLSYRPSLARLVGAEGPASDRRARRSVGSDGIAVGWVGSDDRRDPDCWQQGVDLTRPCS